MNLKNLRVGKGWSQEQLAEISGVSARTIQRLEKGESPGMETLKALAAGFEMSVSELQRTTMEKEELEKMNPGIISQIPKPWRGFLLHLFTFMVVITWLLALISYFDLDKEIAGAVGLPWAMLLMVHAIKNIGSEKPGK